MSHIHIIDNKMRDSLIEMINNGQTSDVSMAINILEYIDLNDETTLNNLNEIIYQCLGLYVSIDYNSELSITNSIHVSYTGARGENGFIVVNSNSISTSYTRPTL